jgi:hypothetical protein
MTLLARTSNNLPESETNSMSENRKVGQPEGKRPPRRFRRRWEDNIKMDLRERGWGGANWIHVVQDRGKFRVLVNTEIKFGFRNLLGNSRETE